MLDYGKTWPVCGVDICAGKAEGWEGEPSEDLGEEPLWQREKKMQRWRWENI